MQNNSSNFQYFSNKRIQYFMATEDDDTCSNAPQNQLKLNQKLKLSKSSGNIFSRKSVGFQNRDPTWKPFNPKNNAHREEMEALFHEQCFQNIEESKAQNQGKNPKQSNLKRQRGDGLPMNENIDQKMKEIIINKGGLEFCTKTQSKLEEKRSFCEDLTQPFTPTHPDHFQEPIQKLIQNQVKPIIQPNSKTKGNQGSTQLHHFQIIKKIGKGVEGQVYLAQHKNTGIIYALKQIPKQYIQNEQNEQNLLRQIKINLYLNDKNIIKLYHVFSDEDNLYMVMEPMTDGDLWTFINKHQHLPQKSVRKIITNICKGISHVHQKDVLHRDLKLENILLINVRDKIMQGIAKLGDFGCAVHSPFMRKSTIGSPNYLSPQQMGKNYYHKKIDIWCVGIMAFELLYGRSPFAKEIEKTFINPDEVPNFELCLPNHVRISEEAEDFLRKTLEINANLRLDIKKALTHPFIRRKTTLQCPI